MTSRAALLALIVCVASCALLRSQPAPPVTDPVRAQSWELDVTSVGPSYALYPTQAIPLRFDHAQHMRLPGIGGCTPCHDQATRSTTSADGLVPPESACTPCHAIDRSTPTKVATPAARCDACHVGFDPARPALVARVQFPPANVTFSHRAHLARGERCEQCHGSMRDVGLATRLELPMMQSCFQCHRSGGTAGAECTECHLTAPDGVLRTRFAEGALNPPEWMAGLHHDADFWVTHRYVAADSGARCATCHRESDCVECHDGRVVDRRIHPNDYVMLHATEARQAPQHCTTCHRMASFCETCHLRIGVAESSSPASMALGRFHPPPDEWSGRIVGPHHHAIEARRALSACVSCHTERDCTSCHADSALGGGGINPHPPGWSLRCGMLLRASPRACSQCHQDLGALQGQCR